MVKATYHPDAVKEWFRKTFGINHQPNPSEIQTNCPYCKRERFYFNIRKCVGHCKHASCGVTPKIKDLIDLVGFGPDQSPGWEVVDQEKPKEAAKLDLPYSDYPLVDGISYEYLRSRRISDKDIQKFDFRYRDGRIYLPVKDESGIIRSYVSRLLPGRDGRRYLYAPNTRITEYLLGWSESKYWPRLTLVENSFVSISLRDSCYCSTNFGSNLSNEQVRQIRQSKIQTVAIIWDEGAEAKAAKARDKLKEAGIKCSYARIKGQPDDHSIEYIVNLSKLTHEAAESNLPEVNDEEMV